MQTRCPGKRPPISSTSHLADSVKSTLGGRSQDRRRGTASSPTDPGILGTPNFITKFGSGGAADTNSAMYEAGGFVGIGMTAPPTALTLLQDGQISWANAAGTNQRVTLYGSSGNYLSVNLLGVEKLRVTPTGIGIAQPNVASGSILTLPQDNYVSWANPGGTPRVQLYGSSANVFSVGILGSEKMRVDATGSVAIGTTVPASILTLPQDQIISWANPRDGARRADRPRWPTFRD